MLGSPAIQYDDDELLHLAIHASEHNQTDKAITYVKLLLEQNPRHGKGRYLLGTLHAEIGLFDRAKEDIALAINHDDDIPAAAHFQLGLLHFTSGDVTQAKTAWQALQARGENDAFVLFARGLLRLAANEFEACIVDLERGIAANQLNEPLNNDMRHMVDSARNALAKQDQPATDTNTVVSTPAKEDDSVNPDSTTAKRASLAAYQRLNYDDKPH